MNFGGMQASTPLAVQNTNQGGGQLEAAVTNFLNAGKYKQSFIIVACMHCG